MSDRSAQITGLVLAGGLGRRMGGVDKGLQSLDGKPLAAHVIERLAPQVDFLLVSANRNREAYAAFGYPVIADLIGGYAGPLAGLHAGLSACTTPLLVCAPCDSPWLPNDLVKRLHDALTADAEIAVPETTGGLQPAFALMRREVLTSISARLDVSERRMQAWCRSLRMRTVRFDDEHAFENLNTPDALVAYHHG